MNRSRSSVATGAHSAASLLRGTVVALGFDPVRKVLSRSEQSPWMRLLIGQIDDDGREGSLPVKFHPTGIKTQAGDDLS